VCPHCRKRRTELRHHAAGRARYWLSSQHPDLFAKLYAKHLATARAHDLGGSATVIRNRARSRALGELQRRLPADYRQRYVAELTRAYAKVQAEEQAAQPWVPYWQERDGSEMLNWPHLGAV
jgi:hypothetical protein